ncbi:methyl-accepting chemotaxis protein [Herpetosiphon giganteus]|uniref:methyl-accepting chemotaxis protein n=1 Tax=Herpetosiphon giganteus TaxID=2029754 RepID=UPI00195CE649|nr:methyl-accepting chemotaxis protein [Herpetosiphon giganteus]MBM7846536.1 ABC-type transporter Mla subunit MlaD [Herpetosiphon giganteus]
MVAPTLNEDLDTLADELRLIDGAASLRLISLRDELNDGDVVAMSHLYLPGLLDPDSVEDRAVIYFQNRSHWLNWLEAARNIIVLLPIGLTWFGLSRASDTYNTLVTERPELVSQPFLLLWERDFLGFSSPIDPLFSNLALLDALLLVVITMMTILVHRQRDIKEAVAEVQAASVRCRVEQVLWRLNYQFAVIRARSDHAQTVLQVSTAIEKFERGASELLDLLRWERRYLEEIGSGSLNTLQVITTRMTEGASNLLLHGRDVAAVYQQLKEAVEELSDSVEGVEQHQQRLLRSLDSISGHSNALLTTTKETGINFDNAVTMLLRSAERNSDMVQSVVQVISDMGRLAANMLEGETTLKQTLIEVSSDIQQSIHHTNEATRQSNQSAMVMQALITSLVDSVAVMHGFGSHVSSAMGAIREEVRLLGQSSQALAGQSSMVLTEVSSAIVDIRAEVARLSDSQSQITIALEKFVNQNAEVTRSTAESLYSTEQASNRLSATVEHLAAETHRLASSTYTPITSGWSRAATLLLSAIVVLLGLLSYMAYQLQQVLVR